MKNALHNTICSLYDTYIDLYKMILNKNHSFTKSEFKALKSSFRQKFVYTILSPDDITYVNPKLKKLILKFLPFNCLFQVLPYFFFSKLHKPQFSKVLQPLLNFLFSISIRNVQKTIHHWGYKSIFEAYCHIFEVNAEETLNDIQSFLISTEKEYKTLLKAHLPYIMQDFQQSDSKPFQDLFILTNLEKMTFYKGNWLSEKYRNANLKQIANNMIQYFVENNYISENIKFILEHRIDGDLFPNFLYLNITLPEIDWNTENIKKFTIFNSINRNIPYLQKSIIHEIGHVITLSNLEKKNDIFTYIPYESAISELGGEFFEILFYFPDFISKIYNIGDIKKCEAISKYNRLYDLISKRFLAIQFIVYAEALQNPKLFNLNSLQIQNEIKFLIKKKLYLKTTNTKMFSTNILHTLDSIRGLLLIQEQFYQMCKNNLNIYNFFQSKMQLFFSQLSYQSFSSLQKEFKLPN